MPILMTQSQIDRYIENVLQVVAKELKIEDYDFLAYQELWEAVFAKNASVAQKYDAFSDKYREWYQFQVDHNDEMEKGTFSPDTFQKNIKLMDERDSVRKALIAAVRTK